MPDVIRAGTSPGSACRSTAFPSCPGRGSGTGTPSAGRLRSALASRPRSSDGRNTSRSIGRSPMRLSSGCASINLLICRSCMRVAIELIEKNRVEQHAGDLRRRRIVRRSSAGRLPHACARSASSPRGCAWRRGESPARAAPSAECRRRRTTRRRLRSRERRTAAPRTPSRDRRATRTSGSCAAAAPTPACAILAGLHPRDRLAGGVTRCGQGERAQPAVAQAGIDAVDRAIAAACSSRSSTSRSGVVSTMLLAGLQRRLAARHQPAAPAHAPASIRSLHVDAEHLVDVEVAPHFRQLVELLDERLLPRGEERRVDGAGRDAGQDFGNGRRKLRGRGIAARRPGTRRARRHH